MNTSQYMDKQIMDLSKSQPINSTDFINLSNPQEGDDGEKEEIVPSYDFQPIRPLGSPPQHSQGLNNGGGGGSGGARVWNSADAVGVRNYSSLDSIQPAKGIPEKDTNVGNAALLNEIDQTIKKYADNLMHALDGVSARISQLESRSRNLENSMDDLKVTVGNNQGSTDGKLRQLGNILGEVQSGVEIIRDKQDILEAQLHLAKLQVSKVEHQPEPQPHTQPDSLQPIASAPLQSHHQQPPPPPIPLSLPSPPPPPAPQQSLPPPVHLPNQYVPNQNPNAEDFYYPPSQQQETAQQYSPQPSLSAPPPQLPPYPPPAPAHYSQPPQQHPSHSMNPPPQSYPPNVTNPSSQQFYNSPSHMYEPPSSRPGSQYSPTYEPPPYPYGGPSSQYGGGGMKQQSSSYPKLPTARVLPQALPTASDVGGGGSAGSSGGGNRVPIDDVVDKVTNMGFPRDQVRATVRRLTENGQSVDLNIVLDKLMNDGVEAQPQRGGWFGR